jgi:hypothetical protein
MVMTNSDRRWPLIPGVDGTGVVVSSDSDEFRVDDRGSSMDMAPARVGSDASRKFLIERPARDPMAQLKRFVRCSGQTPLRSVRFANNTE